MEESENGTVKEPVDRARRPTTLKRELRSAGVMALIFIITILAALFLSPLYEEKGMKAFQNEDAVVNPLLYIVFIIAFTAIVLYVVKKGKKNLIKWFFLGAILMTITYVFAPLLDAAVYGYGEKWNKIFPEDEILYFDADRIDGENLYCYLDRSDTVHASTSSGRSGLLELPPGMNITSLRLHSCSSVGETGLILVELNGGTAGLLTIDMTETDIRLSSLSSHPGDNAGSLLTHKCKEEPNWIAASVQLLEGMFRLNVSDYNITTDDNGSIVSEPTFENSANLSELIADDPILSVDVIPAGEVANQVAVSTADELLLFDSRTLNLTQRISAPGGRAVHHIGDEGDCDHDEKKKGNGGGSGEGCGEGKGAGKEKCEDGNCGEGKNGRILISTDNTIELFGVKDGNWSEMAESKIGEGIDDIDVGSMNGKGAVFVLSDGYVHVFRADDGLGKLGFTEEKRADARFVETADADGDGNVEIYVLGSTGMKWLEVEPPGMYLWVWLVAAIAGIVLVLLIRYYPEWYVVDTAGIVVAVGAMALIGISLAILPVLVLLVCLAVYDAISVYKTKHMISLADNVMDMRLPVLLVIPKEREYSFRRQKKLKEQLDTGEKRAAMFMGLGDVIIPGLLAVSAYTYLPGGTLGGIEKPLLVALCTIAGGILGFCVLMRYVMRGNPQAGLPLLNGGTILGYLISYLLVYQDLGFGLTFDLI